MKRIFFDKVKPEGIVSRRLYDAILLKYKLEKKTGLNFDEAYKTTSTGRVIDFDALCMMALQIISKDDLAKILDESAKVQFADNFLWKLLWKLFKTDLVIPYITGVWTKKAVKSNLVTNVGHAAYAGQFGGSTSTAFTAMAYGTGATAAAVTDTALLTEVARAASTISRVTTSVTNDTFQSVHTFTAGGTQAITEEGILDNNVSGGNLAAHNVFSAVNMISGDTLQFTHQIQS